MFPASSTLETKLCFKLYSSSSSSSGIFDHLSVVELLDDDFPCSKLDPEG